MVGGGGEEWDGVSLKKTNLLSSTYVTVPPAANPLVMAAGLEVLQYHHFISLCNQIFSFSDSDKEGKRLSRKFWKPSITMMDNDAE